MIISAPEDSTIADVLTTFGQLIRGGQTPQAITLLKQNQQSIEPFLYWRNLGMAQLQMENLPEARYSMEKAKLEVLIPFNTSSLMHTIETRLALPAPQGWSDAALGAAVELGPVRIWIVTLLISCAILVTVRNRFSGLLLCLLPAVFALWFHSSTASFVILRPTELFDGATHVFGAAKILPAGLKVLLIKEDGWWRVIYPSFASGWIPRENSGSIGVLWGGSP